MKYKLLKDLPGIKAGEIFEGNNGIINFSTGNINYVSESYAKLYSEFFEPIVEKKTYDDLKEGDRVFYIINDGTIGMDRFEKGESRSEVFLTREEAEDEYKRREWACRKDKFIPKIGEKYYYPITSGTVEYPNNGLCASEYFLINSGFEYLLINSGLAFRTREECEKAIKEHDLIRLFYTIR